MNLVGAVLVNTYEIQHLLGQGGMGAVYRARHLRTNGMVAVKVLSSDSANTPHQVRRFRDEAQIISQLRHPNIVQVVDFNVDEKINRPFFVMELLDGEDLAQRLCKQERLSYAETCALALHVGSALQTAHDQGIVHLDIKPQNLFLHKRKLIRDRGDLIKVLDFGISKICSAVSDTPTLMVLGTPQYMSPEAALGRHTDVDGRADQFSLGVVLYRALSSHLPFDCSEQLGLLYYVVHVPHRPLRTLVSGLPDHALNAIERALSKSKNDRFDSISDFVSAFRGEDIKELVISGDELAPVAPPVISVWLPPVSEPAGASGELPLVLPPTASAQSLTPLRPLTGEVAQSPIPPLPPQAPSRAVMVVASLSLLSLMVAGSSEFLSRRARSVAPPVAPLPLVRPDGAVPGVSTQDVAPPVAPLPLVRPLPVLPAEESTSAAQGIDPPAAEPVFTAQTRVQTPAPTPDAIPTGKPLKPAAPLHPLGSHKPAATCLEKDLLVAGAISSEQREQARKLFVASTLRLRRGTVLLIKQSKVKRTFQLSGPRPAGFPSPEDERPDKYLRDLGSAFELGFQLDSPIEISCPVQSASHAAAGAFGAAADKKGAL